jgi:O-antigen biosynthesis protein
LKTQGSGNVAPLSLFDANFYLTEYPDVRTAGLEPYQHFTEHGWKEGRKPCFLFDVRFFLSQLPEPTNVSEPLEYYLKFGAEISPHPLFDPIYYINNNPDVAQSGVNPLAHFLKDGYLERRNPHPLFDIPFYMEQFDEYSSTRSNPLAHYILCGWREGKDPHPLFDSSFYVEKNPDIKDQCPLEHFVVRGASENRDPHPLFSTAYYRKKYEQHLEGGQNPLIHYLHTGAKLGFNPHYDFSSEDYLEAIKTSRSTVPNSLLHYLKLCRQRRLDPTSKRALKFTFAYELDGHIDESTYDNVKAEISNHRHTMLEEIEVEAPHLVSSDKSDEERVKEFRLHTSDNPKLSIVIPTFNQLSYTLDCLQSIDRYPPPIPYEVIVVSDDSTDSSSNILPLVSGIRFLENASNDGFLKTCNRGCVNALGKYTLLLNNGVQLLDGWLEPLIHSLENDTSVAAVGPKIIFPNGKLQECGALIDRSGNATFVGFGDSPTKAQYTKIHEAEYLSGTCMLVDSAKLREVGYLDEAYAPAYFEDVDLCFKFRERGWKVVVNPESTVVHNLGISSNTEPSGWKLQQMSANKQKLLERWSKQIDELNKVRLIAFYLPQFHTIPENDSWWGKGFTEWRNVARAKPNFEGHYQPHVPSDLGFYDLRIKDVQLEQVKLAKRYGLYGFCYYYYWFQGKRLLEQPIEQVLNSKDLSLPFCLCWANETWSRAWDGSQNLVLMQQNHSEDDDHAVIRDLARYFKDDRYIRINGRPLFVIYRAALFPDLRRTTQVWQDYCNQEGIGEIYLAVIEKEGVSIGNFDELGIDAAIEFPPHKKLTAFNDRIDSLDTDFQGTIYDYNQLIRRAVSQPIPPYKRFRGVMPAWDNTARRQNFGNIFINSSPSAYQAWLEFVIEETRKVHSGEERLVFINAWNEWAEGTHLEPDCRYGHEYLEATHNASRSWMLTTKGT